jgi:nitroreductase
MRPPAEVLRLILGAGVLAPSAENYHYLCFRVLEESVELLSTDHDSWRALPHRRMLGLMAFGAVIENMALRSQTLGLEMRPSLFPDASRADLVAVLDWTRGFPRHDPLDAQIERRHTNRRFYGRSALEAGVLQKLQAAASAESGARLIWMSSPEQRSRALHAIRVAETERFRRRALHQELFGAIRFEAGWEEATDEWLPPVALEVEPPMRGAFKMLRDWRFMKAAHLIGAHWGLGFRAGYLPCALSPHIGMLTTHDGDPRVESVIAGRAFQRLWLAATAEGVALQPYAAPAVLASQQPGRGWVSTATKAKLEQALADLTLGQSGRPHMFFRIGRANAPSGVTRRKTLHHYVR